MNTKEFNLLCAPWIMALDLRGKSCELSLLELFHKAHELKCLAGELPAQDAALLRLPLAVLHAVFTRMDPQGNRLGLNNASEALARWRALWEAGRFPMAPLEKYLEHFQERFWLFHPETPFYQVPKLERGTDYTAAKLMGDVSQSGNKIRMFSARSGRAKDRLSYAEATRWLIYLNAYDDTSAKASIRKAGLPSAGAGWLGKLGLVFVAGDNLFETLMLNFALADVEGAWKPGAAVWEKKVKREERTEIPRPETRVELLTLQSRRIELKREEEAVTGYRLLGGDFFDRENAFLEHMTLWRKDKTKDIYTPIRHDPSRALWRDFSALLVKGEGLRRPGVVEWIEQLKEAGLLFGRMITFQTASVKYGDKDFFVDDVFSDSVTVNAALLTQLGEAWVRRINEALDKTERCVRALGNFAHNLAQCAGSEGGDAGASAREQAYHALDALFHAWLAGIDPDKDNMMDDKLNAWFAQLRQTLYGMAGELLSEAGEAALVGRYIKVGRDRKKTLFAAPIVDAWFRKDMKKILEG